MTSKEKAKDLVCDFYAIQSNEYNYGINWKMAKQCAIITVDEIINYDNQFMQTELQYKHWQEVRNEIEKL